MNVGALDPQSQSKYQQLLSVIEEMGKDIRYSRKSFNLEVSGFFMGTILSLEED